MSLLRNAMHCFRSSVSVSEVSSKELKSEGEIIFNSATDFHSENVDREQLVDLIASILFVPVLVR